MRIIGHLDLDAFFAATEERDNPRFKGLPIVVGADPAGGQGRGVVSTANYKAREYGIHSAMPITRAWRLSEKAVAEGKSEAIFLPVDMEKYGRISRHIMEIIRSKVEIVEEASVDEAYLDLSFTGTYGKAKVLCGKIKREILKTERLTASVGIGPNKLIAKISSGMQKPDGFTIIMPAKVESFIESLELRAIPGIGPKTEATLNARNIKTIKDLKKKSIKDLREIFGKWGEELYHKARGEDDSPFVTEWTAKSIGEQETFQKDTLDSRFIFERLNSICEGVFERFKKDIFEVYRSITITVRFSDFQTKSRTITLESAAADITTLKQTTLRMLMPFLDKRENSKNKLIRLIGVRIEKLL